MTRRVIVDENAGPGTKLWQQFQQAAGDGQYEYVFLSQSHRGITTTSSLAAMERSGITVRCSDMLGAEFIYQTL